MTRGACALAVTARNEARLLAGHLEYHRMLGVEQAYVYLDEAGGATLRSIQHLGWVTTGRCVLPDRFRGSPGLERFVASWESHLAARQALNVMDAMARAEAAGCEWLLSIDADELVCLDRRHARPGALPRALAALPDSVSTAWLPNLEVVQLQSAEGLVFREARHFKRMGGPARSIRDPRSGRRACRTWFLGHADGKSVVRLGRGAVPQSSHAFATPEGVRLPTAVLGELLHYYAYDFQDWLRRNRSYHGHPPRHVSGKPVEPQKLLFVDLVAALGDGALEDYFERNLVLSRYEIERLKKRSWRRLFRRPAVVEVSSVAEAWATLPALQRY